MKLPDLLAGEKHVSIPSMEKTSSPDAPEKDVAYAIAGEHAQSIDPVVEARVVRKLDMFLIPAMLIGTLSIFIKWSQEL